MGEKNPNSKDAPSQDAETVGDGESIFEKVVPEGIKRGLEHLIRDGRVKNLVGELKLPKDLANQMLSQVDETKQAAVKVVAKEVRTFLENTSLADELAKLLTQISFEISTNVRFVPSDKAIKRKGKEKSRKGSVPPDNPASDPPDPAANESKPT
jgi:hypothetical protein